MNKILSFAELQNFLQTMPPEKLIAAFLVNTRHGYQDEWMNEVAPRLHAKGCETIGIVTPASIQNHKFSNTQHIACVPIERIRFLKHINVFIISDMDCAIRFPESSKVVGYAHSFVGPLKRTGLQNKTGFLSTLDAYMIPTPISKQARNDILKIWSGLVDGKLIKRKSKYLRIIPSGYPPMSLAASELQKIDQPPDSITYAPTIVGYMPQFGGNRIENFGAALIKNLLEKFSTFNIIFRPYYNDLNNNAVKQIIRTFASEKKFILDNNRNKSATYARSLAIISDYSTLCNTYSLLTLRPGIYYRPWFTDKIQDPNPEDLPIFYQIENLNNYLKKYITYPNTIYAQLVQYKLDTAMPFEDAFEEIADTTIKLWENNGADKNWVSIKKDPTVKIKSAIQVIKNLNRHNSYGFRAGLTALTNREFDLLLAAFVLHMGKLYVPTEAIPQKQLQKIAKIVQQNIPIPIYRYIQHSIILDLYSIAYNNEPSENGKKFILELLRDYSRSVQALRNNNRQPAAYCAGNQN